MSKSSPCFLTPARIAPLQYLAALAVKSWRVPEDRKALYEETMEKMGDVKTDSFCKIDISAEISEDTKLPGGYVISRKFKRVKLECEGSGKVNHVLEEEFKY